MKLPEKNQTWVLHQDTLPQPMGGGVTRRVLAYSDALMCVENTCEAGTGAPPHSHPHSQIIYVVEGEFLTVVGEEQKVLTKGDSIFAPGGVPHGCTCQKDGIILDVFTPMREDFV